ncbi:MAG: reverse transcriptase domain-containing protein [Candidatus Rokuibacteriota bacterium]
MTRTRRATGEVLLVPPRNRRSQVGRITEPAAIEGAGVERFLAELRDALVARTYRPLRTRRLEIPKDGGKVRVLGIPAIRDGVVQGALELILEPIFEADFCDGSYGYRPQRTAHGAVNRVAQAMVRNKTRVIDVDLAAFFDTVRQDLLLGKVARRVRDGEILHLLKLMRKASGKRGVPQGGGSRRYWRTST